MVGSGKLSAVLVGLLLLVPVVSWAGESAVPHDWNGLYLGGNLGYAGATPHTKTTTTFDSSAYFNVPQDENDVREIGNQRMTEDEFTGGGQIGYNWQDGLFVYGVETDFNRLDVNGYNIRSKPYISLPTSILTIESTAKTDWLCTVRSRIGYSKNQWLMYATGGITIADLQADFNLYDNNARATERHHISQVKIGWTAGAGLEMALDKNWSMRGEYLYADLGMIDADSLSFNSSIVTPNNNVFRHEAEFTVHLLRFSLNYQF